MVKSVSSTDNMKPSCLCISLFINLHDVAVLLFSKNGAGGCSLLQILWVKVVKAFHGHEGGFDNNGCSFKSTWANIIGSSNFLHSKGIILNNSFRFNVGCGTRIRFWKDIWVGEAPLSIRTNIGVRNLTFFRDMLNEIGQLNIVASEDTSM
ncbi:hypothetical protein Tco_0590796 [Tanacetum coccineum]